MNTMQRDTLRLYQKKFPQDTFQDVARKTNIQVTRVFRLFNGLEMKIGEYQKFQDLIEKAPPFSLKILPPPTLH